MIFIAISIIVGIPTVEPIAVRVAKDKNIIIHTSVHYVSEYTSKINLSPESENKYNTVSSVLFIHKIFYNLFDCNAVCRRWTKRVLLMRLQFWIRGLMLVILSSWDKRFIIWISLALMSCIIDRGTRALQVNLYIRPFIVFLRSSYRLNRLFHTQINYVSRRECQCHRKVAIVL